MPRVLAEAGLTLIAEAELSKRSDLSRARSFRNGLMVALLAFCPIRLKNFAALEIGTTLVEINGSWWIVLPCQATKSRRADERRLPDLLKPFVDRYLTHYRPILEQRSKIQSKALWLAQSGFPMSYCTVELVITQTTRMTTGISVSPHLFRTAAASSAAVHAGAMPHLASGVLSHVDRQTTDQHYNRATSVNAAITYSSLQRTAIADPTVPDPIGCQPPPAHCRRGEAFGLIGSVSTDTSPRMLPI